VICRVGEDASGPSLEHKGRPARFAWSMRLFCCEDTGEYIFAKVTVMQVPPRSTR